MSLFYETIFLKKDSSLEKKLGILKTNSKANKDEIYMLETGIAGENQVAYHLNKSNIGMYVLRDVNLVCDDLKAQIDFVVVTSHHCYFIECKNYNADIIRVDETANFEMSTRYGKKYNKVGIKSPMSQVEDQFSVFKKICLNNQEKVTSLLAGVKFKDYFKTIVVFTNSESRLDLKHAPNSVKYRLLKVDNLIRQIEYDGEHCDGKKFSKEQMNDIAMFILENNVPVKIGEIQENIDHLEPIDNYEKSVSKVRKNNKVSLLFVVLVIILLSFLLNNMFGKKLSDNNIEAINNLKMVYNSSKSNGFDLYNYKQCVYLKELLPSSFNCSGLPMQVNFSGDNSLSIYKNHTCYYLKYDLSNKKVIDVSSEYVGYVNRCPGTDVGFINYDPNNKYLTKIGGYQKVLEMARFAHNNNSGFDNYYDYSHIAERGGNPNLASTYKMKVDGYFGTISNKGSFTYDNSLEDFNTMVEYYYYIMK